MTVGLAADSQAGTSQDNERTWGDSKSGPTIAKNSVVITGTISGSLQGRIRPGGREVLITKQTRIYRTGKGSIRQGTFLAKSPVYVIGTMKNGTVYANMVVVSDPKTDERGGKVRKLGPNEEL